ncbi:hypothetical protein FJZ31_26610 [Candidatus Poribacteria bacterium]|nr:hypothetical protein [Candidatus Poribacteria bacterium]
MKTNSLCYFTIAVCIIVFLACGADDNATNQPVKPITPTEEPSDEIIEAEEVAIDFAAEEAAIRELFESHTAAVAANDINEIMKHWLKLETKEVFISHEFLGVVTISEKWSGVKEYWSATRAVFGVVPSVQTMDKVGIDARAQNATLSGKYVWEDEGKYLAAFRKDKDGKWKIRAIDFGDKGLLKEIK